MPEGEIAIFDIDFNREPFILNVISEKDINYHLKEISSSKELFLQIVHAEDKRDPRKLVIRDSNRANYKIMTKLCKNTNKLNNLVALDYIFGKLTLIDYEQSKIYLII